MTMQQPRCAADRQSPLIVLCEVLPRNRRDSELFLPSLSRPCRPSGAKPAIRPRASRDTLRDRRREVIACAAGIVLAPL